FNLIEGVIGMERASGFDQEIILHNYGEIRGAAGGKGYVAYDGDHTTIAIDTIENHGLMFGDVELGGGADSYDGTGGRVEKGLVSGGDGDDHITGGNFADLLLGDAGADTISGAGGNDQIQGGGGDDTMAGGAGDDLVFAGTEA